MTARKLIIAGTLIAYIIILHLLTIFFFLEHNRPNFIPTHHRDKEPWLTPHYRTMVSFHKRIDASIKPGYVLFIGDSLTQGLCVSCITDKAINFGIGNDTTYGAYERLKGYRSRLHAKAIVFAIGVNDLKKRDVTDIIPTYDKLINLAPHNVPIVISAVLPIDSMLAAKKYRNKKNIHQFNRYLRKKCMKRQHCTFVDSGPKLIDKKGNLDSLYHLGDGIHLSPEGYEIWIEDLQRAINTIEYE